MSTLQEKFNQFVPQQVLTGLKKLERGKGLVMGKLKENEKVIRWGIKITTALGLAGLAWSLCNGAKDSGAAVISPTATPPIDCPTDGRELFKVGEPGVPCKTVDGQDKVFLPGFPETGSMATPTVVPDGFFSHVTVVPTKTEVPTNTPEPATSTPTTAPSKTSTPTPIAPTQASTERPLPTTIPATPKPDNPRLPGTPDVMPNGSYPTNNEKTDWSTPPMANNPCEGLPDKFWFPLRTIKYDPNKNLPWGEVRYVCTYNTEYKGYVAGGKLIYEKKP